MAYPCFMFTGVEEYQFGNVFDKVFPNSRKTDRIIGKILKSDKSNAPVCATCWDQPFCFGCIGQEYLQKGGQLAKSNCNVMEAMTEGFLCAGIEFLDRIPNWGNHSRNGEKTIAPSVVTCKGVVS